MTMITIEQIRAARAMLGLKQSELAVKASLSTGTLNNLERGAQTDPKLSTLRAIQHALETEGIEFIGEETGGIGIRFKPTKRTVTAKNILIVDDNNADRQLYKVWLGKQQSPAYIITEAADAKEGYEAFIKSEPDCIILDFMMYGKDGFQMLVEMKKEHVKIPPIIFVTAMPSEVIKRDVLALGVHSYLDKKHLTREKLHEAVVNALS